MLVSGRQAVRILLTEGAMTGALLVVVLTVAERLPWVIELPRAS
jgi:hypothetical protein